MQHKTVGNIFFRTPSLHISVLVNSQNESFERYLLVKRFNIVTCNFYCEFTNGLSNSRSHVSIIEGKFSNCVTSVLWSTSFIGRKSPLKKREVEENGANISPPIDIFDRFHFKIANHFVIYPFISLFSKIVFAF